MIISQKSLDAIIFFEVSSEAYYNKFLQSPTWPQGASGITIGIGYDLGYNTPQEIQEDWQQFLSPEDLSKLRSVAGLKGNQAHAALSSGIKQIQIPLNAAKQVFLHTSMPKSAKQAIAVYPELPELMPDACGGILSLVYNRGNSLESSALDSLHRRKEMAAIKPLIANKDYEGIADQIIEMKRLWKNVQGLLDRRDKEASLIRHAVREYKQEELIEV